MAGSLGLPQIIVPGAADTIVLPPRDQVPEKFSNRTLNFHNPTMTTMRTTPEENIQIGEFIAEKLSKDSYVNIMEQYGPCYRAYDFPKLARPVNRQDMEYAYSAARSAGLHRGF